MQKLLFIAALVGPTAPAWAAPSEVATALSCVSEDLSQGSRGESRQFYQIRQDSQGTVIKHISNLERTRHTKKILATFSNEHVKVLGAKQSFFIAGYDPENLDKPVFKVNGDLLDSIIDTKVNVWTYVADSWVWNGHKLGPITCTISGQHP